MTNEQGQNGRGYQIDKITDAKGRVTLNAYSAQGEEGLKNRS